MAGVLPQTNASLLSVQAAGLLNDSFFSDDFGSGSGSGQESGETKWSGKCGVWMPPPRTTRDSSPDGRDVVTERRILMPVVCGVSVGDQLQVLLPNGEEQSLLVSGVVPICQGVELGAGQVLEITIEVI